MMCFMISAVYPVLMVSEVHVYQLEFHSYRTAIVSL